MGRNRSLSVRTDGNDNDDGSEGDRSHFSLSAAAPSGRVSADFQGCVAPLSAEYPPNFRDICGLTRARKGVILIRLTTSGRRSPRFGRGSFVAPSFARIAFTMAMVAFAFAVPACDQPPLFGPSSNVDAGTIHNPRSTHACRSTPASVAGGDAGTDGGSIPPDYSIVVLPDTQYYAAAFPEIFMKQASWIVENRDAQQIAFVLHTGDHRRPGRARRSGRWRRTACTCSTASFPTSSPRETTTTETSPIAWAW